MNAELSVLLDAATGGMLGAAASYLYLGHDGFRKIPTTIFTIGKELQKQRLLFLLGRILFGVVCASVVSFSHL